jgi:hypothetical protein
MAEQSWPFRHQHQAIHGMLDLPILLSIYSFAMKACRSHRIAVHGMCNI